MMITLKNPDSKLFYIAYTLSFVSVLILILTPLLYSLHSEAFHCHSTCDSHIVKTVPVKIHHYFTINDSSTVNSKLQVAGHCAHETTGGKHNSEKCSFCKNLYILSTPFSPLNPPAIPVPKHQVAGLMSTHETTDYLVKYRVTKSRAPPLSLPLV